MEKKISYNQLLNAYKKFDKAKEYNNCLFCLQNMYKMDKDKTYKLVLKLRTILREVIKSGESVSDNMNLLKLSYILSAKDIFDDYCIALEWNRETSKKFYLPRRPQLLQIVKQLQRLEDNELDLLCISTPPGIGKTTLAIFYLTWVAGKHPDQPILGGSHNNSFLNGVYNECLRIVRGDGEYIWTDIFKNIPLVSTNAKEMRLDLGTQKRFETFEFSSIGSGNAGKVRAGSLLYCDDLVDGIETAMSKERLDKLWQQYYTDLRQRKIGNCKELHIATRWSVHDVIGRLALQYEDNPRAYFLALPAMNDKDESNFDYPFGLGFTTEFYRQQREIMDDASWRALYMNIPIEREGLLYEKDQLRRYFTLPDKEPDAILAVCDTKDKGTDYCCMPIAYQYGQDFYIDDIICDNSNPEIVEARLIMVLNERRVQMARFESNAAGGRVAEKVQQGVKELGGKCKITTKFSTQNKETKIIVNSGWVKEHCLFKDESTNPSKEYTKALNFLCGYTMAGKNKYDDVADAFAQLAIYVESMTMSKVEIVKRFF